MQIAAVAGARVLATVRTAELREAVAALGATVIDPAELVERAHAEGGADVVLELVGAPNLDPDLSALALKGRIVIVGTGAGAEAPLDLRKLMGRRARVMGTMLRARPLDEKAAAVRRSRARSSRTSRPVGSRRSSTVSSRRPRRLPRSTGCRSRGSSARCCSTSKPKPQPLP